MKNRRYKIVVLANAPEVKYLLSSKLDKDRYEVFAAGTLMSGMVVLDTHVVDLIICQMNMPEMDGFKFAQKLRNDQRYNHISFLLLVDENLIEMYAESLEADGCQYVTTPLDPEAFIDKVTTILDHRMSDPEHSSMDCLLEKEPFEEAVNREIDRIVRYGGTASLATINTEELQNIRENSSGDLVLHTLARIARSNCRSTDLLGKAGPDRLMVFMPETKIKEAQLALNRIRERFACIVWEDETPPCTLNAGIAQIPNDGLDLLALRRNAEETMAAGTYNWSPEQRNEQITEEPG